MNEIIESTARTASTIAAEIRFLDRQAADTCIRYIIEIGRRLVEAKALVEDGQWLNYIKTELNYEKSTAQNYMRLYERFGTGQKSLFGSFAESQTFGSLTYTKALALLQVPEEDLEEFAESNDIANMSTRELKQAIRQRDEAIRAKEEAEQRAEAAIQSRDTELQENIQLEKRATDAEKQVERLTAGMVEAADKLEEKDAEIEKLRNDVLDAVKKESDAKAALKKARENPDIPTAMMEQLRAEAEAAATEKATADAKRKLDTAIQQSDTVREELRLTQQKLEAAQKLVQFQNPDAAHFKYIYKQVQLDFEQLIDTLKKVKGTDAVTGEKLQTATIALLDKLRNDLIC